MWTHDIAYVFGGLFLANAVPHTVAGMMGRPLQSPFAKPSGEGYSSSAVNVAWGFANLAVAYLLLVRVGSFDLHSWEHVGAAFVPAFAISMQLARHFGRFNGGNEPDPDVYAPGVVKSGSAGRG